MRTAVWIFGYGSLIWRPDFPFLDRRPAALAGWARRFWQGSHDHRGVPDAPGRVVTLVRVPGETCVGMAYRVEPEVFEHLDYREKNGYERAPVSMILDGSHAVDGVVYIAAIDNHALASGTHPWRRCRQTIPTSSRWKLLSRPRTLRTPERHSTPPHATGLPDPHLRGPSGSNIDYLLELADALRGLKAHDAHVFALEAAVRAS